MKPPRKPTRSSSTPPPHKRQERRAPGKTPSASEQARRAADSWGVAPDDPKEKKGRGNAGASKGTLRVSTGRTGKAPQRAAPGEAPRGGGRSGARSHSAGEGGREGQTARATSGAPSPRSRSKDRTGTRDEGQRRGSGRSDRPFGGQARRNVEGEDRNRGDRDRGGMMRGEGKRPSLRDLARASGPTDRSAHARFAKPSGSKPRSAAPGPVHKVKAAGEPQRIAKLLARAGIASRREIERMIEEGRIALDGAVIDTPATLLPNLRGVTVDGQPVAAAEQARLFLFHKPSGCLTTERDPAGRPTIYDRLPDGLPRLMPIGRLDMTTEGLLLLTNDGELKRKLELPASGIERTYRARAFGEVTQQQLESLIEGIEVDGIRYGRIDANLERRTGRNQWIEMTLTEGKNREVRRVLEHLDLTVNRLIRVRYGPFDLSDSQPGDLVEIKRGDMDRFLHYMKDVKGGS